MGGYYWIASYPKSGNTWLRLALWSLAHDGAVPDLGDDRLNQVPICCSRMEFDNELAVDSSDLPHEQIAALRPRFYEAQAARSSEPLLRKVHDGWTLTPAGEPLFPPHVTLGTVYLVRDPRDIVPSLAHHAGITIDDQVASMERPAIILAGQAQGITMQLPQCLLNWSAHVASWLDAPGRPALVQRYEDLLGDPVAALTRIAAYLDLPATAALIDRAVASTRFDRLQAAEARTGFFERPRHASTFFRRGRAGGWRTSLTRDQVGRIEAMHGAMMARMGYL
ncbi:sulfotransferase domain-containing protein [Novosphingobium sp. FSW06-99]|uniref:sulfotransferase domain-containing protein n=1 Tax=Novosphingobium sp. FSW06-99 TaxID=1739113 RepID=UPI00076CA4D9|nr:sulfotransferase domain-containing protein [Novosphingobium sp. FSW06-99]KUR78185.1 hypothetical protein AQZ49_07580 [Novosphingobium sp. FSW06-99]